MLRLSTRAEKRKEDEAAHGNTKAAKGKKKSAKKLKAKKPAEEVDMQGTMLAVLEVCPCNIEAVCALGNASILCE